MSKDRKYEGGYAAILVMALTAVLVIIIGVAVKAYIGMHKHNRIQAEQVQKRAGQLQQPRQALD